MPPFENPTDGLVTGFRPQALLPQTRRGPAGRGRVGVAGDRLADLAGIEPDESMVSAGAGAPAAERISGLAAIPSAPPAGGPRVQMPSLGPASGGLPAPQGISGHRSSLPAGGDYKALLLRDLEEQLAEARAVGDVEAEMAIMEKIAEVSGTPGAPGIQMGPGDHSRGAVDPALSEPLPGIQTPDAPPITSTVPVEEINQFAGMARARDEREAVFDRDFAARMATDPAAEANRRPESEFGPFTPGGGNMDTGLAGLGRAQAQAAVGQGDPGLIRKTIDRIADTAPGMPGAERYLERVASEMGGGPAGDTSGHGDMSIDGLAAADRGGLAAVPPRPMPRPGGAPPARQPTAGGGGLAAVPSSNQLPPQPMPRPAMAPPEPEGDTSGHGGMLLDDPAQNQRDTQEMAKAVSGETAGAPDVPKWALPMLAAGLGMMASNNPNGMAAIGEGGLAGLKSWLGVKQAEDKRQERREDVEYRQARLRQDADQAREMNALRERLAKAEAEAMAPYRESQIRANDALANYRTAGGSAAGGTSKAVVDAQRLNKLAEDYALTELGLAKVPDDMTDPEAARRFADARRRHLAALHQQYGIPLRSASATGGGGGGGGKSASEMSDDELLGALAN